MTNKERFIELLRSTKREGIEKLIDFLEKTDFFTAPASTRFHMSCEGGLLQHSLNVYDCLAGLGTTTGDVQEFQAAGMRLDSIPQPIRTRRKISHDGIRVYPPDHGGTIRNQMAHGNERGEYHPDILPGRREIPTGIIHAHGRPDGHKLPGDQHRKQETGRHLPRNGTGSAGSGRIRRGRAYLTGGQP